MSQSTCTINIDRDSGGVYWCASESGEFSNSVNITVQSPDGLILESPPHPVTEGDPVTLSCLTRKQQLSNVLFYHYDKRLRSTGKGKHTISAVSKSDEGFYKCEHSGKRSLWSWVSVKVPESSPTSSSSSAPLIIGLIIGLTLIILLLLFGWYRRSKDLWCTILFNRQRAAVRAPTPTRESTRQEVTFTALCYMVTFLPMSQSNLLKLMEMEDLENQRKKLITVMWRRTLQEDLENQRKKLFTVMWRRTLQTLHAKITPQGQSKLQHKERGVLQHQMQQLILMRSGTALDNDAAT